MKIFIWFLLLTPFSFLITFFLTITFNFSLLEKFNNYIIGEL